MPQRTIGNGAWLLRLARIALIMFAGEVVSAQTHPESRLVNSDTSPIRLAIEQKVPGRLFMVDLRNSGSQALVLNLGTILGNGREQYANRVRLQLTQPDGKVLHLEMVLPGAIAGRMDPMVVPLPPGATYCLLVELEHYCAPKENIWKLNLRPGSYGLRAEYTGIKVSQESANLDMIGISFMPYWTGSVRSDVLSSPSSKSSFSPRINQPNTE